MIEEGIIRELEELYTDITLLEFYGIRQGFKAKYDRINNQKGRRRCKRLIYSWHMADYKKERIWEYLNGDINDEYFVHFVDAVHKNWFK